MKSIPAHVLLSYLLISGSSLWAQRQRRTLNYGEQSTVEVEIRRWRSDLVSEMRLSTPGAPGTDIDPTLDLGLPNERTFDYHFAVRLTRRIKVRANFFRVRYDADTIAGSDLTFGGKVFPSGSTVSSFLELEQRRGGLEVDLLTGQYGYLAVVAEWMRFEATTGVGGSGEDVTPAPLSMNLPVFGLKTRVYLTPALAVSVEGVGMKRESVGVMTDFDASATYNAVPNLAFTYGYRNSYNRFKDVEPESRMLFRLRGQYFGVTIRF